MVIDGPPLPTWLVAATNRATLSLRAQDASEVVLRKSVAIQQAMTRHPRRPVQAIAFLDRGAISRIGLISRTHGVAMFLLLARMPATVFKASLATLRDDLLVSALVALAAGVRAPPLTAIDTQNDVHFLSINRASTGVNDALSGGQL